MLWLYNYVSSNCVLFTGTNYDNTNFAYLWRVVPSLVDTADVGEPLDVELLRHVAAKSFSRHFVLLDVWIRRMQHLLKFLHDFRVEIFVALCSCLQLSGAIADVELTIFDLILLSRYQ